MTNKLDAASTDGQLMALQIAVRMLAKQVETLSNGEPFLAKSLQGAKEMVDAMAQAFAMVEEVPEPTRSHVERMLATADMYVERLLAPGDVNISIPIRH